jgi:integrase
MTKRNPDNERIKRRYLLYLKDAKGRDEASLDAVAKALARFEEHSKCRDFRRFHIEQARAFKTYLSESKNERTGQPLSASTVYSTLGALRTFFEWLAQQPGYRSTIKPADAAYFTPPENVARVATAHRYKPCPSLEDIRRVLRAMPHYTDIERRDRALVAFTITTGARDRAIISFKLKHIDLDNRRLDQDARQVGTKRAKTFSTWFFPVGDDIERIVTEWVTFLRAERAYGAEDPIFPKTRIENGVDLKFRVAGLDRAHWANTSPVRAIFRDAFTQASLPYFNPHAFRNTLVQLAYDLRLDPERFRAWSQNLGHESCLTTFSSYGTLPPRRQGELIRSLAETDAGQLSDVGPDLLRRRADQMERRRAQKCRGPSVRLAIPNSHSSLSKVRTALPSLRFFSTYSAARASNVFACAVAVASLTSRF